MRAAQASILLLTTLGVVTASARALPHPVNDRRDFYANLHGAVTSVSSCIQRPVTSIDWHELPTSAQLFFRDAGASARDEFATIEWEELPPHIRDWIQEHPYQTAFYVVNGVVFLAPGLVTTPLLGLLGFTARGPAAGTIAAAAQAALKPVAAKGLFATLQSAAMGGYGAPLLAEGVQVGAAIAAGAVGAFNHCVGGRKDGGIGDGQSGENELA